MSLAQFSGQLCTLSTSGSALLSHLFQLPPQGLQLCLQVHCPARVQERPRQVLSTLSLASHTSTPAHTLVSAEYSAANHTPPYASTPTGP